MVRSTELVAIHALGFDDTLYDCISDSVAATKPGMARQHVCQSPGAALYTAQALMGKVGKHGMNGSLTHKQHCSALNACVHNIMCSSASCTFPDWRCA